MLFRSGILLYQTLHKYGFATKPESTSADDDLKLINCRITNAVKCLPPQNKPVAAEINTCNNWLSKELNALPDNFVIIALGSIAHKAVIMGLGLKQSEYKFGHATEHQLASRAASTKFCRMRSPFWPDFSDRKSVV